MFISLLRFVLIFLCVLGVLFFAAWYSVVINFKGRKNEMIITGVDVYTDEAIPVDLVVVKGDEVWTSLIFVDNITGFGMWRQIGDDTWYFDLWVDGDYDLYHDVDAERITGICGAVCGLDWEASANEFLADYGLKLGRFDVVKGDRYELVEI